MRGEEMKQQGTRGRIQWLTLPILLIFLGSLILKLLIILASAPYGNMMFDTGVWKSSADLGAAGENVYVGEPAYKYSPLWWWLITGARLLSFESDTAFFTLIKCLLLIPDLLIGVILYRKFDGQQVLRKERYWLTALWLYNPLVIAAAYLQGQFDLYAMLFLLIVAAGADVGVGGSAPRIALARWKRELVAGVGLAFKHVCLFSTFAFLWGRESLRSLKSFIMTGLRLALPMLVLLLPYLLLSLESARGVIRNVILFSGGSSGEWGLINIMRVLGSLFIPLSASAGNSLPHWLSLLGTAALFLGLPLLLYLRRERPLPERLFLSVIGLGVLSTSFSPQHFLWVLPFAILLYHGGDGHHTQHNLLLLLYSVVGSLSLGCFYLGLLIKKGFLVLPLLSRLADNGFVLVSSLDLSFRILLWAVLVAWVVSYLRSTRSTRNHSPHSTSLPLQCS